MSEIWTTVVRRGNKKEQIKPKEPTGGVRRVQTSSPSSSSPKTPAEGTRGGKKKKKKGRKKKKGDSTSAPSQQQVGATKKVKIITPKTAAIIISPQKGVEDKVVAELSKAKGQIDLAALGIETLKPRPAITGAVMYEVPGTDRLDSSKKADLLAQQLAQILPVELVKVSRPTKRAELRVVDLDDTTP